MWFHWGNYPCPLFSTEQWQNMIYIDDKRQNIKRILQLIYKPHASPMSRIDTKSRKSVCVWFIFKPNGFCYYHSCQKSGPWFNIKLSSYQYRKSYCGDKTVVRSSYLHNGISYTSKMASFILNLGPVAHISHVCVNTQAETKMGTIFQTTFSNAFSWMKMYKFRLKFHWSLFLWVQLTISQHWFRPWLGTGQVTSHCLNQCWLVYWCIYASLCLSELMKDLAQMYESLLKYLYL